MEWSCFPNKRIDVYCGIKIASSSEAKIRGEATDEYSMAAIGTAQPFILGGIASLTAECGAFLKCHRLCIHKSMVYSSNIRYRETFTGLNTCDYTVVIIWLK